MIYLGFINRRTVSALLARLYDADEGVQLNVIHALKAIGDKRALTPLRNFRANLENPMSERAKDGIEPSLQEEIDYAIEKIESQNRVSVPRRVR